MVYLTDCLMRNGGVKMNIPLLKSQLHVALVELEEKYLNSKVMSSSLLKKMGEVYEMGLPQVMKAWVRVIEST